MTRAAWTEPARGTLAAGFDSVRGNFDFGDTAEGEEEFYQVFWRLDRRLLDDVGDGVGDRGVEEDAPGLNASEIYAHELAWFEHEGAPFETHTVGVSG
jgi:hypothetical protein